MSDLTVYNIGETVSFVSAGDSDTFENDGRVFLFVAVDGGSGNKQMAVAATRDCNARHGAFAGALIDRVEEVQEGGSTIFGPFDPHFHNGPNGRATVSFDDKSGVQIAAVRFPEIR